MSGIRSRFDPSSFVNTEKPTAEEVQKAIAGINKAKKDADEQLATVKDDLAKAVKEAADTKKEADEKLATQQKAVGELTAARDSATRTLSEAIKKLEAAKMLPPKAGAADLVKALDRTIEVAQAKDPGGRLAELQIEVKELRARLVQQRSPREMLRPLSAPRSETSTRALATRSASSQT